MKEELREEAVNPEAQRLNFGPKHEMCSEEKQPWDGSSQTATSCELKFTITGCITLQDPAVVINADKKDITFCVESESSIKGDTLYLCANKCKTITFIVHENLAFDDSLKVIVTGLGKVVFKIADGKKVELKGNSEVYVLMDK